MFSRAHKALVALFFFHAPFGQCRVNTIIRDVAIIGGGASGTFSAVRLRDEGKSVVLIEKENILGGHVNTYQDPVTGTTVDYGVEIFHDMQIVKDYFNRLNVSWAIEVLGPRSSAPDYLDGNTGQTVKYKAPNPVAGLIAYAEQLSKYLNIGLGFFLPDPVPDDFLLPFGQFLAKYPDIGNATYTIFSYGQGLGNFLDQPTLYVFKNFGLDIIQGISSGFLVTTSSDNYEIYDHATKLLGSDVLLSSRVVSTQYRGDHGVELDIETPTGTQVVIAKKLLIAIPQKLNNMNRFALDTREANVFREFGNSGYYTSLVRNTGLPANFTSYSVSPDTPYNIPRLPGVYDVVPTAIHGVFDVKYGSPHSVPDGFVRKQILSYIKKLQANGFAENVSGDPEFVAFKSHTPFELTVSRDKIANGFYKDFYSLQGHRNTWYTGAALHTQDSSLIWNFTESYVLPELLK
ncbi:FAD/NAD(P)-binding domain-containing protein [Penicillium cinerascens]|uniref:FAD/NAD(P)-binding domain-containing protein n=1 Tax=Penicillium cinerascens TaxID=70096 RepID=A0A9W9TD79_9EURO|nr:FAD/NAD(P)-binding domain-containing protein [Penicillium cinerascens]KAJ5218507.1 FAD/NAD(P)-binding domain-containing protein [Penicillium cinerascens]